MLHAFALLRGDCLLKFTQMFSKIDKQKDKALLRALDKRLVTMDDPEQRKRFRAVKLLLLGRKAKDVARLTHVNIRTARRWLYAARKRCIEWLCSPKYLSHRGRKQKDLKLLQALDYRFSSLKDP